LPMDAGRQSIRQRLVQGVEASPDRDAKQTFHQHTA